MYYTSFLYIVKSFLKNFGVRRLNGVLNGEGDPPTRVSGHPRHAVRHSGGPLQYSVCGTEGDDRLGADYFYKIKNKIKY